MPGLRPAWSPSPAHHNLAREGRKQPVGPPRGGQQLQAHPPANFAATAQRPPGHERGWQVGSLPKRPSTPQARWRQQSAVPAHQRGRWSVCCACSGKGRSGAWSRSVDRQPCTASSCPRAKSAVTPRGEHTEQVVGSGRGTKQQKQPRGLQV